MASRRTAIIGAIVLLVAIAGLLITRRRAAARAAAEPGARMARFSGHVRDLLRHRLEGAVVHAVWIGADADPRAFEESVVGADGAYMLEVRLPPAEEGVLLLLATAEGHETAGRSVELDQTRQDFALAEGGARVTVRVRDQAGKAVVAGQVTLTVEPRAGEPSSLVLLSATSGADGNATFERVTNGAAFIHWTARAAGRGNGFGTQSKPWGQAPMVIDAVLRVGGELRGLAVDEKSQPVPDVVFGAAQQAGPWGQRAKSDATGHFVLHDVPTGDPLSLRVDAEAYMLANGLDALELTIPPGQQVHEVRVALQPSGTIVGTVRDHSGNAIPGATVEAIPSAHLPQSRKNAAAGLDGSFRLGGLRLDSEWDLEVRHPAFAPGFVEHVRAARPGPPVPITLSAGGAIAGLARYDDGSPAPGVEIYAHRVEKVATVLRGLREHASLRTGLDGVFRIDHLNPGSYRFELRPKARMAWSPIAAQVEQVWVEEGGVTQVATTPLARSGALHLRIGDGSREVSDTLVYLSLMRAGNNGAPQELTLQRGPSGEATLNDLEPGRYDVIVRLPRNGYARTDGVEVQPGQTAEVDIDLPARLSLEGFVQGADGKPSSGARVEAFLAAADGQKAYRLPGRAPANFTGNSAFTDAQGHFRMGGLEAGPHRVRVESKGETPLDTNVTIRPAMEPVRLSLRAGGTCEVLLLDERNAPLADKVVVIERDDGGPAYSNSAISSAEGVARFAALPAGEYEARAVIAGQPRVTCRSKPRESSRVEVRATRTASR